MTSPSVINIPLFFSGNNTNGEEVNLNVSHVVQGQWVHPSQEKDKPSFYRVQLSEDEIIDFDKDSGTFLTALLSSCERIATECEAAPGGDPLTGAD